MANCNGINCVVPCHVMGKHEIFSNISNKFYTYHLLILQGLFTRLSGMDLFFLSGEDSWALSLLCAAFSHARILLYGFIKSDSDLFKEKFQPTFCGGFGNHLFSKLILQERGLRFRRLCSCLASDIESLLLLAICDL